MMRCAAPSPAGVAYRLGANGWVVYKNEKVPRARARCAERDALADKFERLPLFQS
jgi:hypothetical protein